MSESTETGCPVPECVEGMVRIPEIVTEGPWRYVRFIYVECYECKGRG